MPFKIAVNWLFDDIWCYLVFSCFDGKIGVFQQTVLRGLLYPYSIDLVLLLFGTSKDSNDR